MIVQLTRGAAARYCVCYDCTPDVEKAVYHGSRAWTIAISPLRSEDALRADQVAAIKNGLSDLYD